MPNSNEHDAESPEPEGVNPSESLGSTQEKDDEALAQSSRASEYPIQQDSLPDDTEVLRRNMNFLFDEIRRRIEPGKEDDLNSIHSRVFTSCVLYALDLKSAMRSSMSIINSDWLNPALQFFGPLFSPDGLLNKTCSGEEEANSGEKTPQPSSIMDPRDLRHCMAKLVNDNENFAKAIVENVEWICATAFPSDDSKLSTSVGMQEPNSGEQSPEQSVIPFPLSIFNLAVDVMSKMDGFWKQDCGNACEIQDGRPSTNVGSQEANSGELPPQAPMILNAMNAFFMVPGLLEETNEQEPGIPWELVSQTMDLEEEDCNPSTGVEALAAKGDEVAPDPSLPAALANSLFALGSCFDLSLNGQIGQPANAAADTSPDCSMPPLFQDPKKMVQKIKEASHYLLTSLKDDCLADSQKHDELRHVKSVALIEWVINYLFWKRNKQSYSIEHNDLPLRDPVCAHLLSESIAARFRILEWLDEEYHNLKKQDPQDFICYTQKFTDAELGLLELRQKDARNDGPLLDAQEYTRRMQESTDTAVRLWEVISTIDFKNCSFKDFENFALRVEDTKVAGKRLLEFKMNHGLVKPEFGGRDLVSREKTDPRTGGESSEKITAWLRTTLRSLMQDIRLFTNLLPPEYEYDDEARRHILDLWTISTSLMEKGLPPDSKDYIHQMQVLHDAFEGVMKWINDRGIDQSSKEASLGLTQKITFIEEFYEHYFEEIKKIGQGAWGHVYEVQRRLTGSQSAVKKLFVSWQHVEDLYQAKNEALRLADLSHPNIVKYHFAWIQTAVFYELPSTFLPCTPERDSASTESPSNAPESGRPTRKLWLPLLHSLPVELYPGSWKDLAGMGKGKPDFVGVDIVHSDTTGSDDPDPPTQLQFGAPAAILHIEMELCWTTLEKWLENRHQPLGYCRLPDLKTQEQSLRIFKQVMEALEYAHSRRISHQDIKLNNIFMTADSVPKLGDFGLSNLKSSIQSKSAAPDTDSSSRSSRSPRTDPSEIESPFQIDIFDMGRILLHLLFQHLTEAARRNEIRNIEDGKTSPVLNKYPTKVKKLVLSMLEEDHTKRPTAQQILDNPLFSPTEQHVHEEGIQRKPAALDPLSTDLRDVPSARRNENSAVKTGAIPKTAVRRMDR